MKPYCTPQQKKGEFVVCRCCRYEWDGIPVLSYPNMPSIAQLMSGNRENALSQRVELNVLQCPACGLVQLEEGVLVPYYRDVIRSSAVSPEMMAFRQMQFSQFTELYDLSAKSFLEVGCGRGEYLGIMSRFISAAQGIENSTLAVQHCIAAGMNVLQGFIEDEIDFDEGSLDSFGIFNFLEHMPNPVDFLRSVRGYLKPNAVGIVEVPNFNMMIADMVFSDFSSEHLSYFTAGTLRTTLELAGFEVNSLEPVWHGHILSAVVQLRPTLDAQSFKCRQEDVRSVLISLFKNFYPAEVAVWGAGHQSLATIAQLGLQESIGNIVDTSPLKQGKYSPASGIPIHSPSWLNGSGVKLLLINASSYSGEVHDIVRREYSHIPYVYIFDNGRLVESNGKEVV
jgi:SAM-dependent methyltransferase